MGPIATRSTNPLKKPPRSPRQEASNSPHIVERELLEHRPEDEKNSQQDEHDPCKRILYDFKQIVPCYDRCFVADKPQSLQARHDREQHKKSEKPEVHLKCDYIPKVLLHQPEGLHDCKKPVLCPAKKVFHQQIPPVHFSAQLLYNIICYRNLSKHRYDPRSR